MGDKVIRISSWGDRKPVVVVNKASGAEFEQECRELADKGYVLSSSKCGFLDSEEYDFCASYQAIFVVPELIKVPTLTIKAGE